MTHTLPKDVQSVEDLLQKYGKWSLERMMRELESTAAERDQYKQIAELNAETIKNMKQTRRDRLRALIPETSRE